ncbi:hypothetical protein MBEHAL_0007 [Halarchaeum acidiphilum MH1-52-1]|uniref:Uncharacterized protein n=1 Tax=Halarchaeum acidiphilum MH1-52-1 TaxID=1261545 RepID=U2YRA5_9EURY|nr:hypothetical protein MBEHAL_0007 [Halarchaeum acidiphilum MH1-52-1]
MEVHGDGVSALDARESIGVVGERERPAEGGVHVEPRVVRGRAVGERVERVDRPEVRRPGGADDGEDVLARLLETFERRVELLRVHPMLVVRLDGDDGVVTETEMVGGLLGREVRVRGADDPEVAGLGRQPIALDVVVEVFQTVAIAREQERLEVRLRAAAGDDAVGLVAEVEEAAERLDEAFLDDRRGAALVVGVERLVRRGHQRLRGEAGHHRRAVEVRGRPRVRDVDAVREDVLGDLVDGGVETDPRLGEDVVGQRLADRLGLDPGERVVGVGRVDRGLGRAPERVAVRLGAALGAEEVRVDVAVVAHSSPSAFTAAATASAKMLAISSTSDSSTTSGGRKRAVEPPRPPSSMTRPRSKHSVRTRSARSSSAGRAPASSGSASPSTNSTPSMSPRPRTSPTAS